MGRPKLGNNDPIIGTTIGRWQIISYDCHKNGLSYLHCICNCGTKKSVLKLSLQKKTSTSCGCFNREQSHKAHYKDSFCNHKKKDKRKFYQVWHNMKYRCQNSKHPSYKYYGLKGISVCNSWKTFYSFKHDMYESYVIHCNTHGMRATTLDRRDSTKNYTKDNCVWATPKHQNSHLKFTANSQDFKRHRSNKNLLQVYISRCMNGTLYRSLTKKFIKLFGISPNEFRLYISTHFVKDMTWNNYGFGKTCWCIDHIIPCNQFDLSKESDKLSCFHYTNLQPLWWNDNLDKRKYWPVPKTES